MGNTSEDKNSKAFIKKLLGVKNETTAFYIMIRGLIVMLFVSVLCATAFSILLAKSERDDSQTGETYHYHYAFIADDTEPEFWDEVYKGAKKEADEEHVYVERMEDVLAVESTTEDLLRLAIHSNVDGIIYYGEDSVSVQKLIEEAVKKGIFVVTVRQDIDGSARQCFVGVSSYDLGQEYGKQILEILSQQQTAQTITILVDDATIESRQTMFTMGIQDVLAGNLEEELMPDIRMQKIDTSDAFSAEEAIRDIFVDEGNLPDILVCLSSIYTQCAYQAAVDYNHVGDVKIIGYYASDKILEAIEKQIVYSTIRVETEEIGRSCVNVLTDYQKTGYANSYVPVGMQVIDSNVARKLLSEVKPDDE